AALDQRAAQTRYGPDPRQIRDQRALQSAEVKLEVQEGYNRRVARPSTRTGRKAGRCASWYLHPVSGRNCTIWPGFTWRFRQITRHFDPAAYHFSRLPAGEAVAEETVEPAVAREVRA